MQFYRIVQFNTRRHFRTSISIRVSDSVPPVTYSRPFFRNKPGHKIYRCISVLSIQHHTLLHNPTIIHTNIYFAPPCHPHHIYGYTSARSTKNHILLHNPAILHTKKCFAPVCHPRKKILSTSKYISNIHLSWTSPLFPYLRFGLGLGLRLNSNHSITRNWYKSLHATTKVDSYFYFYIICKCYNIRM